MHENHRSGSDPARAVDESQPLSVLQADFLATTTRSMPLAGAIVWAALGVAALWLTPDVTGRLVLYIILAIMPLAAVLDLAQGRRPFAGGNANPLTRLFLSSITGIAVMVPLVIFAATRSGDGTLIVLGMAILAGIIWIPYGWAAADPAGLRHAVGRALAAYAAFLFAPPAWQVTAICGAVVLSYAYSLAFMRRPVRAADAG